MTPGDGKLYGDYLLPVVSRYYSKMVCISRIHLHAGYSQNDPLSCNNEVIHLDLPTVNPFVLEGPPLTVQQMFGVELANVLRVTAKWRPPLAPLHFIAGYLLVYGAPYSMMGGGAVVALLLVQLPTVFNLVRIFFLSIKPHNPLASLVGLVLLLSCKAILRCTPRSASLNDNQRCHLSPGRFSYACHLLSSPSPQFELQFPSTSPFQPHLGQMERL